MKKINATDTFLLTGIVITLAVFEDNSQFTQGVYYYSAGTCYQRLEGGHNAESDCREQTIRSGFLDDESNWTITQPTGYISTAPNDMSLYIGKIAFPEDFLDNGGSDNTISLDEAVDAVYAAYVASSTNPFYRSLPTVIQDVGGGTADIFISSKDTKL